MTAIIVPSSSMTGAEFFNMVFGKTDTSERDAELSTALNDHIDAVSRTWSIPKLADQIDAREALTAAYVARVREIERRYFDAPYSELEQPERWVA